MPIILKSTGMTFTIATNPDKIKYIKRCSLVPYFAEIVLFLPLHHQCIAR